MTKKVLSAVAGSVLFVTASGNAIADGHGNKDHGSMDAADASAKKADASANANLFEGAPSGEYKLEKTHAYIAFSYDHQGFSNPILRWGAWDATLDWNAEDPAASSVLATIDVESIDSGVDEFNDHLKAADFFDLENHDKVSFTSTKIVQKDDTTGTITGDLVIKGNSHPVTLDVKFNKAAFDGRGNVHKIGFSGKAEILRSEWDLGKYAPFVSDEVTLWVEAEFIAPPAE